MRYNRTMSDEQWNKLHYVECLLDLNARSNTMFEIRQINLQQIPNTIDYFQTFIKHPQYNLSKDVTFNK